MTTNNEDETEYIKPVIPEETVDVPTECDTCGTEGVMEPIRQVKKAWFGDTKLVVGYNCPFCGTSHLYR